jgi:hypothetical protein
MFKSIFYFEFEFRKSRTIKRDTNSGLDETKCFLICKSATSFEKWIFQGGSVALSCPWSWQRGLLGGTLVGKAFLG